MTKYLLPNDLGEVEVLTDQSLTTRAGEFVWAKHPDLGLFQIRRERFTEVKPPLPPEPILGSVVVDDNGRAWQRVGPEFEEPDAPGGTWWCVRDVHDQTWETLLAFGPVLRMVPDPLAEAPELPWRIGGISGFSDRFAEVEPTRTANGKTYVRLGDKAGDIVLILERDQARQMGLALLRAAAVVVTP